MLARQAGCSRRSLLTGTSAASFRLSIISSRRAKVNTVTARADTIQLPRRGAGLGSRWARCPGSGDRGATTESEVGAPPAVRVPPRGAPTAASEAGSLSRLRAPFPAFPSCPRPFPGVRGPLGPPPVRSHPAPGSRVPPSCPRPSASPARRRSGCPSVLVPGRATFAWSLHALGRSTRSGSLALLPRLLGRLAHERAHQSLRLRACRQGATPKPQHTELPTAWRSQAPAGTEARGRGDCREGASDFPAVQSCWRTASSALGSGWGNRACEQIPGSARCGNLGEVGGPASLQPDPWSLQATPAALPSSPDSGVRPTEYIPSWSHSPTTFRGDWQPVVGLEGEEAALGGGW